MAQFTVNADRLDPYKAFKFRVKIVPGDYVAGVSRVSNLTRTTNVVEHRDGAGASLSHKSPGRTTFPPITLERGITHDREFEAWAQATVNFGAAPLGGREVGLRNFRRNMMIEVYNEAGQLAIRYNVYRCWVSEYQALPDLDANADAVAIERIRLEHEGWERDPDVQEPQEPTVP